MDADTTRRTLVDTATRLLVKNRGVSTGEIAAAAGVGRTTLHRYFATRDDLVRAVGLAALDRSEEALSDDTALDEGDVEAALLGVAVALTPFGPSLEFLLAEASLTDDPEVRARTEQVIAPLAALVDRAREEGLVRAAVPVEWVVDAFFGLLFTAWEGVANGTLAPRSAPHLVVDTLLRGVSEVRRP